MLGGSELFPEMPTHSFPTGDWPGEEYQFAGISSQTRDGFAELAATALNSSQRVTLPLQLVRDIVRLIEEASNAIAAKAA